MLLFKQNSTVRVGGTSVNNEEKKVESLEENNESVETLGGTDKKENGVQPLEKGTVIFLAVFLGFLVLFVIFLPNISSFIAGIGEETPEVSTVDEEETDVEDNSLVELEDVSLEDIKAEVTGQVICASTDNTGLFASDKAYGYDFADGELVKVNEYRRFRYADISAFDLAKTFAATKQEAYVANDGITGTTTVGENNLVDRYTYDLTVFDYTTEILVEGENVNVLKFESLIKENVISAAEADGMVCTGDIEEETTAE